MLNVNQSKAKQNKCANANVKYAYAKVAQWRNESHVHDALLYFE